eukprot:jgi/Ulvmu1/7986/UM004_0221.1
MLRMIWSSRCCIMRTHNHDALPLARPDTSRAMRQVQEAVHHANLKYNSHSHDVRAFRRGWYLDYSMVPQGMFEKCQDSFIPPGFTGSDHSPLELVWTRAPISALCLP